MASENITVPRALLGKLLDAVRATRKDARRDRVLHDETIAVNDEAGDAADEWMKEKVLG